MPIPGVVITGRGKRLNMHDLIQKARTPQAVRQPGSEIGRRPKPTGTNQPTLRGFMPQSGRPSIPVQPESKPVPTQTLAELTEIVVDKAVRIRPTRPGEAGMSPSELAEQVILKDVMGALQKQAPAALAEAERIERSRKKKPRSESDDLT